MNIGQAAKASGIAAKIIRYYERIGLVPQATRLENGYRAYGTTDVHRLRFVRCARHAGFSLEKVRELLGLWSDHKRSRSDIKAMASACIAELENRATDLADAVPECCVIWRAPARGIAPSGPCCLPVPIAQGSGEGRSTVMLSRLTTNCRLSALQMCRGARTLARSPSFDREDFRLAIRNLIDGEGFRLLPCHAG